ncbi:SPG21 (predicted) [Pycnogonum litorale]
MSDKTKVTLHAPKFGITSSDISNSAEYKSFRSSVPSKKISVDDNPDKVWRIYDAGPRSILSPLICMPPVSGTADVYFRQLLSLSAVGYRVIAVDYPIYWTIIEFCSGFRRLLDHLGLDRVHLFGCSLGGFLAQKFAESTSDNPRVQSLILCNTFNDTSIFRYTDAAVFFWLMPSVILKKIILNNLPKGASDLAIADSIDFIVETLESLSQKELASRLTLNCVECDVNYRKLQDLHITIVDVFDICALTDDVLTNLYKCYPYSKLAHLKSGGNFPFISRADQVNLHIRVHLRKFEGTKFSARDSSEDVNVMDDKAPEYDTDSSL